MDLEKLREAGFETPNCLMNSDGVELYFGTNDGNDWCLHLPHKILKHKSLKEDGATLYALSKEEFFRILKKYVPSLASS